MTEDRDRLDRATSAYQPDPDGWDRVQRRVERRQRNRRITAGVVSVSLAVGSFVFVWSAFRGGQSSPPAVSSHLDPGVICHVPAYDPDVALLVGDETKQYPSAALESAGESAADIKGPSTDRLRAYLASAVAGNAPIAGWRVIATTKAAVTFAAPPGSTGTDWWVVGFARHHRRWHRDQEEIVEQEPTPAQLGHDLRLTLTDPVVMQNGSWDAPLVLTNAGSSEWTHDGLAYWGIPHVFDPSTGQELGANRQPFPYGPTRAYDLLPGIGIGLPIALGGVGTTLPRGSYDLVVCVPGLGLASSVGALHVVDRSAAADGRVLTYPPMGSSMAALGGGILTLHNGCVAVAVSVDDANPEYVVWPDGYALVDRGGRSVLVDPIGQEVGALGDQVTLGGGDASPEGAIAGVTGGVPAPCRDEGHDYFVTSGVAG